MLSKDLEVKLIKYAFSDPTGGLLQPYFIYQGAYPQIAELVKMKYPIMGRAASTWDWLVNTLNKPNRARAEHFVPSR